MHHESRKLVVKDNALIEASFNLSLVEQRLVLMAIVEAREIENLTPDTPIEIRVINYNRQFNVGKADTYSQLMESGKQLFGRQFSFIDKYKGVDAVTTSRWVNEITYTPDTGMVVIYLNKNVIRMITRLEIQFTKYFLDQMAVLKSQYSIRFYELFSRYLPLGKSKKFELQELRKLLGISETEYKSVAYLKRDVIDKALNEINQKTDLTASYEQFKDGRKVSHILFRMKQKTIKNVTATKKKLTEKQLDMFSDLLSRLTSFQHHYIAQEGITTTKYAEDIREKLNDSFYIEAWLPYLKEVGFKG